jgi:uncharacterized iron-regulated membrane protein
VHDIAPEVYARVLAEAVQRGGEGGQTVILLGPTETLPRFEVRLPRAGHAYYADRAGQRAADVQLPWTNFVSELHENLHLAFPYGIILVAVSGLMLAASLLTGIAAHPRLFKDAFKLRLGGGERLQHADVHNRLGVWGLPFHFVIALTGTAIPIAAITIPLLLTVLPLDAQPSTVDTVSGPKTTIGEFPDVAGWIRNIEAYAAPARVSFVMLEGAGTNNQVLTIDTDAPGHLASGESYRITPSSTEAQKVGYSDGDIGLQIQAALVQLHYGWFGGWIIRFVYALLGLSLCTIVATGFRIWIVKRLGEVRWSGIHARVWDAIVWGQPAAIALTYVFSQFLPVALTPIYLILSVAILASSIIGPFRTDYLFSLRLGCATAIIAMVMANVARFGLFAVDPGAIAVSVALIAVSVIVFCFAVVGRRLQ